MSEGETCKYYECRLSATCIMYPYNCDTCQVTNNCMQCMNRVKERCLLGGLVGISVKELKNERN